MNVLVVGLGQWGTRQREALEALGHHVEVSVHKAGPSASGRLGDPEWPAVIISTPDETHKEYAFECLSAGMHCLIAKPLALTSADACAIRDHALYMHRIAMPGYTYAYHPVMQRLEEGGRKYGYKTLKFHWDKQGELDSNLVHRLMSHHLFMTMSLWGHPVKQSLMEQDGWASGQWVFENGIYVFSTVRVGPDVKYHKHDVLCKGDFENTEFDLGLWNRHCDELQQPLRRELEHFFNCVRGGGTPKQPSDSRSMVQRACEVEEVIEKMRS